jgi:lipid-A-disaccharide synthase
MKTKKIFIIAGEKSGDFLGASIIKAIKKKTGKNIKLEFMGVGGELMQMQGLRSIFPMEELSVMGILEIVPKLFKLIRRIKQTAKAIFKAKPDLILTIDAPDFCFRVMKKVKKLDKDNRIKKAHLIAPSVWAYRKGRAKKIAKLYDLLLCILPFEPPYFEKHGLKTIYIGHPIFDNNYKKIDFDKERFLRQFNINKSDEIISITPGSRLSEVSRLLPIAVTTMKLLNEKHPNLFVFIFATKTTEPLIRKLLKKYNFKATVIFDEEEKRKAMGCSKLALAKSGTNTFEFNIYKVPMVIFYKFNWLTTIIGRMIADIHFANLVNIIANREIIPECVLEKCKPSVIAKRLDELLRDKAKRKKQIAESQRIIQQLGFGGKISSADRGAEEILKKI